MGLSIAIFLAKEGVDGYYLNKPLFLKQYGSDCQPYLNLGCNTETFTNSGMLELETLGPLTMLEANDSKAEHLEHWFVDEIEVREGEDLTDKQCFH